MRCNMPKKRISSLWRKPLSAALRAVTQLQRSQTRATATAVRRALRVGTAAASKVGTTTPTRPKRPKAVTARDAGTWHDGVALGPGGARRYRLFMPRLFTPGSLMPPGSASPERLPLIVMLHGCGQSADGFALSTRMNRIAVKERFGVLYPEQDRHANLQGCWNWYDTDTRRAYREAATLIAAIDQVVHLHPLAADRVAVAGLSAGASMAALLASRHPERFAAVVMHSGVPPGAAHSTGSALRAMLGRVPAQQGAPSAAAAEAAPAMPPLLVIHGTADRIVATANGEAAVQAWAAAAGAAAAPSRIVQRGQRRAMTVTDFKRRGQTVATLCLVDRLGHAWSGGAASQRFSDAAGPDASRMVWAFAARQFARLRAG